MMAQAIIESDFGQSDLSVQANNYFGIKGSYKGNSIEFPTGEYTSNGKHYMTDADFRSYPTIRDSIADNARLLKNGTTDNPQYYSGAWTTNTMDASEAAMSLSQTYATDMNYGIKLNHMISKYHLKALDTSNGNNVEFSQVDESSPVKVTVFHPKAAAAAQVVSPNVVQNKNFKAKTSKVTVLPEIKLPQSSLSILKEATQQKRTILFENQFEQIIERSKDN